MAVAYIATRQFTVGVMTFERGEIVPWSLIGSTAVFKRLLVDRKIRVKRAK